MVGWLVVEPNLDEPLRPSAFFFVFFFFFFFFCFFVVKLVAPFTSLVRFGIREQCSFRRSNFLPSANMALESGPDRDLYESNSHRQPHHHQFFPDEGIRGRR